MSEVKADSVRQSHGLRRVQFDPVLDLQGLRGAGRSSSVDMWWLGQAGFAIRHSAGTFIIDPYLSDSLAAKYVGTRFPHRRMHLPPIDPADLRGIDVVLHSHAHTDHLDPWTIEALLVGNSPAFVAPRARRDVALERHIPVEDLRAVTAGDTVFFDGLKVTAVPAAHEQLTQDDRGDHVFLGYVIEVAGTRIYHSGDCAPYSGQAELLSSLAVDVALLPVNGRDANRLANGVPGNFDVDEAVALCAAAGIPELVCHHFGLFDFNTVDPMALGARLEDIADGLAWTVPAVGAGFHIMEVTND